MAKTPVFTVAVRRKFPFRWLFRRYKVTEFKFRSSVTCHHSNQTVWYPKPCLVLTLKNGQQRFIADICDRDWILFPDIAANIAYKAKQQLKLKQKTKPAIQEQVPPVTEEILDGPEVAG